MTGKDFCVRAACLLVAAATLTAPLEALGSPARRLARRGVVVIGPPPGAVAPVPVPAGAVPPGMVPLVVPPGVPVIAAPVPRSWRRRGIVAAAPSPAAPAAVVARQPAPPPASVAAAKPPAAVASPSTTGAASSPPKQPTPAAAEEIPAPLPTPAPQSAVAGGSPLDDDAAAFTSSWFEKHPTAWQPGRGQSDWWKGADVAGLTAWLRQPVTRAAGNAENPGAVTTAGADVPDADGLRSVLVFPAGNEEPVARPGADADWLPLGVFAVVPPGGVEAHNYQQLAVDRSGTIKGNFYDAVSDSVLPVSGSVDRDTLQASWTVGANGSRFEAAAAAFTTAPRTVTVRSGGRAAAWELRPVQKP